MERYADLAVPAWLTTTGHTLIHDIIRDKKVSLQLEHSVSSGPSMSFVGVDLAEQGATHQLDAPPKNGGFEVLVLRQ